MSSATPQGKAVINISESTDKEMVVSLRGRLDVWTCGDLWNEATRTIQQSPHPKLILDGNGLDYCDSAGAALLNELCRQQQRQGGAWEIRHFDEGTERLLRMCQEENTGKPLSNETHRKLTFTEEIGKATLHIGEDIAALISFVGELCVWIMKIFRHPRLIRFPDMLHVVETAGLHALPIIAMIGLLLGLILAFQAAIPMAQFGAEIFVANLVSISLLRELGPLITAIILTARSGSAFAAEIGTMKINEEIDALTTMGMDPVRFLVVPRVLGAVIVTPLLAVFANLFGLIGAGIVMLSLGFPLVTYINQLAVSVHAGDFLGGLFKAFVFGILISAVGCQRGLQTGTGASAVGASTTRSVVSGIVLIVIVDGLFAVAFYYLGI